MKFRGKYCQNTIWKEDLHTSLTLLIQKWSLSTFSASELGFSALVLGRIRLGEEAPEQIYRNVRHVGDLLCINDVTIYKKFVKSTSSSFSLKLIWMNIWVISMFWSRLSADKKRNIPWPRKTSQKDFKPQRIPSACQVLPPATVSKAPLSQEQTSVCNSLGWVSTAESVVL